MSDSLPTQNPSDVDVKVVLIGLYAAIGVLYALYKQFFGHDLHGFFYHLGQGIVWPLVMFPSLGKAVSSVLILVVFGWIALQSLKK